MELYEVPPKETLYSILQRTKISADSLYSMNPYLRNGLKEGMVLTIPKTQAVDSLAIDFPEKKTVKLEDMLSNFKTKKFEAYNNEQQKYQTHSTYQIDNKHYYKLFTK